MPEYRALTSNVGWEGVLPHKGVLSGAQWLELALLADRASTLSRITVWRRVRKSREEEHRGLRRAVETGGGKALRPLMAAAEPADAETRAAWPADIKARLIIQTRSKRASDNSLVSTI